MSEIEARSLAVVSAGLREPSSSRMLADRLAEATVARFRGSGRRMEVRRVELREHARDITNNLLTGFASEPLDAVKRDVTTADGLIVVSPIFSASYNGLFKSFFDVLDEDGITGVPVMIGATGGTARHSLALEHALRPLFTYLRAEVVPTSVYAAPEDWGAGGERLEERIGRAAGQLAAAVRATEPGGEPGPFGDAVPFEELLRGS